METKTIDIDDDYEILLFFNAINKYQYVLWLWQTDKKKNRIVHFGKIRSVEKLKKTIFLIPPGIMFDKKFLFEKNRELFFYSEQKQIAGKIKIKAYTSDGGFSFNMPNKLTQMPDNSFRLFEQENEEKFIHLREAPRKKVEGICMARVIKNVLGLVDGNGDLYALYDLSQGGMSFLSFDPSTFSKGDKVTCTELDGKKFPKALVGEVVAIRTMEHVDEQIKICVKFV